MAAECRCSGEVTCSPEGCKHPTNEASVRLSPVTGCTVPQTCVWKPRPAPQNVTFGGSVF